MESYLPPGTIIKGRYRLGRSLGVGGFGITYLALDTEQGVPVTVKEMFLNKVSRRGQGSEIIVAAEEMSCYDENKKQFLNEAKILEMLSEKGTEGIVGVKDYFEANNTAYIVMEYLQGETLKDKVKKNVLTYSETMELMEPVVDSLKRIHQLKIVHLDVSPDNIMILNDGRPILLDFGGAKTLDLEDSSGQFIYKKGYAPLEQRSESGRIGEWSDVFSLAATIYYCMTGKKPEDVWERMVGVDIESFSKLEVKIPSSAEKAIWKALEPDPADRFRTIDAFWKAFSADNTVGN